MNRTPLYDQHLACGARMVDFHGWMMPLHYGSQLDEHHKVRQGAGMFDTSHMTVIDVAGEQAKPFLQRVLANDVDRLKQHGKALYSAMLNEDGGVIDDLIVYFFTDSSYRLIVNSATREKDLAWLGLQAQKFSVTLTERDELAMIAVQGPKALAAVTHLLNDEAGWRLTALKPFFGADFETSLGPAFIATTGYTGEAGCEILIDNERAATLWQELLAAGVVPCGLGARDTLRLEAGMNLYGQEMDEDVSPLAANMGWTIAWQPEDRDFIGRSEIEPERQAPKARLIGLLLEEKGVLRTGQALKVTATDGSEHAGIITSGSFSPTLGKGIALARIPAVELAAVAVDMRKNWITVKPVKPCFVRHGQPVVTPL